MVGRLRFVLAILFSPFRSKIWLEAENAALRHQLFVLRRNVPIRSLMLSLCKPHYNAAQQD
jgi:hypothetical protein